MTRRPVVYFLFRKHYISTVPQCDLPSPPALTRPSGAPVFINNAMVGSKRRKTIKAFATNSVVLEILPMNNLRNL